MDHLGSPNSHSGLGIDPTLLIFFPGILAKFGRWPSFPQHLPQRSKTHRHGLKTKPGRWGRDETSGQNPPAAKEGGEIARGSPQAGGKDNSGACEGWRARTHGAVPGPSLWLSPPPAPFLGSPRLTPPPEGGWYILDDSKSLKRAREGGFLRFGLDQLGLQADLPR